MSVSPTHDCYAEDIQELIKACKGGDLDVAENVLLSLKDQLNIDEIRDNQKSLLHIAAIKNDEDLIDLLLQHGCEIDIVDTNGNTALHSAVEWNSPEAVRALLEHGADMNIKNSSGNSALPMPLINDNPQILSMLLARGFLYEGDIGAYYRLCEAIMEGSVKLVEDLLIDTKDPNFTNLDKESLLTIAATRREPEIVRTLLDFGVDVDCNNFLNGHSALHVAVMTESVECVKILLEFGADVNFRDDSKNAPLHYAAQAENGDLLEILARNGADLYAQNSDQETPIHWAHRLQSPVLLNLMMLHHEYVVKKRGSKFDAERFEKFFPTLNFEPFGEAEMKLQRALLTGDDETARSLIDSGKVDLRRGDFLRYTALHYAVYNESASATKIGKLMLDNGAEVDCADAFGNTALLTAVIEEIEEFVEFLLKEKADVTRTNLNGESAVFIAVHKGNEGITDMLLRHGASLSRYYELCEPVVKGDVERLKFLLEDFNGDVNFDGSPKGESLLYFAAMTDQPEIARLLVSRGARINEHNQAEGFTALHKAAERGNLSCVTTLLELGADVNCREFNHGSTALDVATEFNREEIVEVLLQNGADPNSKSRYGQTALATACEKGHVEIVRLLLKFSADAGAPMSRRGSLKKILPHYYCPEVCENNDHKDILEILRAYTVGSEIF